MCTAVFANLWWETCQMIFGECVILDGCYRPQIRVWRGKAPPCSASKCVRLVGHPETKAGRVQLLKTPIPHGTMVWLNGPPTSAMWCAMRCTEDNEVYFKASLPFYAWPGTGPRPRPALAEYARLNAIDDDDMYSAIGNHVRHSSEGLPDILGDGHWSDPSRELAAPKIPSKRIVA
eukprot:364743-Chlamydomonas_euryale.AAC.98